MRLNPVRAALLALAAAAGPNVVRSAGWELQPTPTTVNLHSVNFEHSTDARAWACGDEGTILYTSNGGATWVRQETGTTANLHGIVFHEENGCVIAVGEQGTILRTTNNGTSWISIPSPTSVTLRDASDFRFYAVGDGGTILKSSDLGLSWAAVPSGTTTTLRSVIGLEPFPTAVGDGGLILRGNSAGTSWSPLPSGSSEMLNGIPLFQPGLVVGDAGTILKTSNFGASWNAVPSGTSAALYSIGEGNGAFYAVGADGTILKSADNGNTWGRQLAPVGTRLNGAFFYLFPNVGYAVGDHGVILKTTDGGGPIVADVPPQAELADDRGPRIESTPNPFQATTTLRYELSAAGPVRLHLFDVAGRNVGERALGWQGAGAHEVEWPLDGLPAGSYTCRIEWGARTATTRLVRLP